MPSVLPPPQPLALLSLQLLALLLSLLLLLLLSLPLALPLSLHSLPLFRCRFCEPACSSGLGL